MIRQILILVALATMVVFATTAQAEYGEWEDLCGLDPPGYSNALFMDGVATDEDTIFAIGMHQPTLDELVYSWVSTNGGYNWDKIVSYRYGADPCDMMKMMNFMISVAAGDNDTAMFGGFGISDQCIANLEIPWCMFLCMFTLGPKILYTDDGGAHYYEAQTPFVFGSAIIAMTYAEDDIYYAVGDTGLVLKSVDSGKVWERITSPYAETAFNDVQFLDADTGYVVGGDPEPESKLAPNASEEDKVWHAYDRLTRRARYFKDPEFRTEVRALNAKRDLSGKGLNGRLFKTIDGGETWELLYEKRRESFSYIMMIDEETGWMVGSPVEGVFPDFSLYKTTDGGYTWDDYTDRVPLEDMGNLSFGIMGFSFSPNGTTGFIGGAAQQAGIAFKSLLFYSVDAGETWHFDEELLPWGHPIVNFTWAADKMAYALGGDLAAYRYTQTNEPPIADAGDDLEAHVGDLVVLDGSDSYDPDGDTITYEWTQVSGADVELTGADGSAPTFAALEASELIFELEVSDGQEASTDQVKVTVLAMGDDDSVDDDDDDNGDDDDDDDSTLDADDDDDDDDDGGCGC